MSAYKQLERVDAMPPELRECVHEFGLPIVTAFVDMGIRKPNQIRHLVSECWRGARQAGQKNPERNRRAGIQDEIDWILIQAEAQISAAALIRHLWQSGLVVLPMEPTACAIQASMQTVSGFTERVTKPDKHKRRLRAAHEAEVKKLWPHLVA